MIAPHAGGASLAPAKVCQPKHSQPEFRAALLDVALTMLGKGIATIPVISRDRKKIPLTRYKRMLRGTLPKEDALRGWYEPGALREAPNGVAIVAANGIGCRDWDKGRAGYDAWAAKYPDLAAMTPTVLSPRGVHVWCFSDYARNVTLGDGEWRGNGFTLIPPSIHYTGPRYEWMIRPNGDDLPFIPAEVFIGARARANALDSGGDEEDHPQHHEEGSLWHSVISALSVTTPEGVIEATLPTRSGERNDRVFDLARGLKFNIGIIKVKDCKPHVRDWHSRCVHVIETKDFDDTWRDFIHGFKRAKRPLGQNPLDAAAMLTDPKNLPLIAEEYDSAVTRKIIGLCYNLHVSGNGGWFFLSSHDIGNRVNAHPMIVWRTLQMLIEDEVLLAGEKGVRNVKATRYRWIAKDEEVTV